MLALETKQRTCGCHVMCFHGVHLFLLFFLENVNLIYPKNVSTYNLPE